MTDASKGAMDYLEIDALYEAALEEPCTCGQDELPCKHCILWEKARHSLRQLAARADALRELEGK